VLVDWGNADLQCGGVDWCDEAPYHRYGMHNPLYQLLLLLIGQDLEEE
jgi:hypothetical protein